MMSLKSKVKNKSKKNKSIKRSFGKKTKILENQN